MNSGKVLIFKNKNKKLIGYDFSTFPCKLEIKKKFNLQCVFYFIWKSSIVEDYYEKEVWKEMYEKGIYYIDVYSFSDITQKISKKLLFRIGLNKIKANLGTIEYIFLKKNNSIKRKVY